MKKNILAIITEKCDGTGKLKGIELKNRDFAIIDREAKNVIKGVWLCQILKTIDDKKQDKVDILYPIRLANLSDGKLINDRCSFRVYKDGIYAIKTLIDNESNMRIGKAYYKVLEFEEEFKFFKDFGYTKEIEYDNFIECVESYIDKVIHNCEWLKRNTEDKIKKRGMKGNNSKKVPKIFYSEKEAIISEEPYHKERKSDVDHPMESDYYDVYVSDTLTEDEITFEWDYENDINKYNEEIIFINKYFRKENIINQFIGLVTYGEEDILK